MPLLRTHQRLDDSEADEKDRVVAGVCYPVRYMGAVAIPSHDEGKGKGSTDEAVTRIYDQYSSKSYSKCLKRMELFVSANCVSLRDPSVGMVRFKFPTIKITFCNTDTTHQKAFAFVVKDLHSSPFTAIVVQCESTAMASDLFAVMSEAFRVRSSLYQAKRLDKAGWTTGLLLSQRKIDEEKLNGRVDVLRSDVPLAIEDGENGEFADAAREADPNNNGFGEFACAGAPPQSNGRCAEFPNGALIHNGAELFVAKMLRERGRRGQSVPFAQANPWAENTLEQVVRNGQASGAKEEESAMDDFLMFARERSMSVGPNI